MENPLSMHHPLHVLVIGAHPDDNELNCGGLTLRLTQRGHKVQFVSVTNGDKGHFAQIYLDQPALLATRRAIEAQNAAAILGAEYKCMGLHDGEVYVDQSTTNAMLRQLRSFGTPGKGPDLVLFNRTVDYHRDHRYTAQLVVDATYMLTVPMMCPSVPHLSNMPVFAQWYDGFTEQGAFVPEIAVPIDDVFSSVVSSISCHASQFYEWLPYNTGTLNDVPSDAGERHNYLKSRLQTRAENRARASTNARLHGDRTADFVEAFRVCEYGRKATDAELSVLFTLD